jgi:DNA-directed RNA polymerase specialized sigma24 family protein
MVAARLAWGNVEAQTALARYESIVRAVARRLTPAARFGHALDEEDLCAEGRVAVLEALRTYAGFGIEERTWVRTRVRQRMIDAIRRLDVRTRDEVRQSAWRAIVVCAGWSRWTRCMATRSQRVRPPTMVC